MVAATLVIAAVLIPVRASAQVLSINTLIADVAYAPTERFQLHLGIPVSRGSQTSIWPDKVHHTQSVSGIGDINDAVDRLASVEPRLARAVECRFFGGLSAEETGEALGVTTRTAQRDWAKARMRLRRALSS
jgi:DNA-directed RNA polymerase specialized sigma24 family protein